MIECIAAFPIGNHTQIWPNIGPDIEGICVNCQLVCLIALGGQKYIILYGAFRIVGIESNLGTDFMLPHDNTFSLSNELHCATLIPRGICQS